MDNSAKNLRYAEEAKTLLEAKSESVESHIREYILGIISLEECLCLIEAEYQDWEVHRRQLIEDLL